MLATTRRGQSTGEFSTLDFLFRMSGSVALCLALRLRFTPWRNWSKLISRLFLSHRVLDFAQNVHLILSGFRQRPWWDFCPRSSWCQLKRWSTMARSSSTSTTSWAKLPSCNRREQFLLLSNTPTLAVHISSWSESNLIWIDENLFKGRPPTFIYQFAIASPPYLLKDLFKVLHFVYSYDFKGSINIK